MCLGPAPVSITGRGRFKLLYPEPPTFGKARSHQSADSPQDVRKPSLLFNGCQRSFRRSGGPRAESAQVSGPPTDFIRKFVLKAARLADLVRLGSLPPPAARFLEAAVLAGQNVIVAGGTQAGKTTMLNCLAAAIPGGDRIVSAEEVFELRFSHPDWVPMQTRQVGLEGTGEVSLRDLVRETLRMRPTRIIVGEVRAAECLDLLLALNAGLPGLATLHANSAREALVKLCTLPLLAGENISARFVVPTVASSVDLVVHLGIDHRGVRRVNEIVAVPGRVENDIVEIEPIFVRQGGDLVHAGGMPSRLESFQRAGIDVHRILRSAD